jgi:hypothetical protein
MVLGKGSTGSELTGGEVGVGAAQPATTMRQAARMPPPINHLIRIRFMINPSSFVQSQSSSYCGAPKKLNIASRNVALAASLAYAVQTVPPRYCVTCS